jgi:hypothetical protein
MSDDSAKKAIEAMGLSLDEVVKADEEIKSRRQRYDTDRSICLCGHPMARHTVVNGVVYCKPARMECPCKKARPVLEAHDLRKFIRRTNGGGALHALTRGILSHVEEDLEVKWLVDLECDRCGEKDDQVVPVPVTQSGSAMNWATGYDALLCRKCRTEV